jgi:predicted RecA/RadA family phage recombinase
MKNFVQPGNTITLTAPYAVASGDGLLVGYIFGVAAGTAGHPASPSRWMIWSPAARARHSS